MTNGPLIEAEELAEHLGDSNWFIADCRHQLMDVTAGERSFLSAHIPAAQHVHLDRDLSRTPRDGEGRHPLPEPDQFCDTLQRLGVAEKSKVVAYDDCGGAMAARLWWMLRWVGHQEVSVLNGGLPAWLAKGFPVETGVQTRSPTTYTARAVHADWVVATVVLAERPRCAGVLLDARSRERFEGRVEPIDAVAGHIPGAVNLPFDQLLAPNGCFAEPGDLRELFEPLLGDRSADEVVAMCGSGVTACHLLLGLAVAGLGEGRLYAGSWSEWIRDPGRPVATGA